MTNDIFLSPHFKLSEFVVSETASRHGIDNTPPEEAVENLRRLCQGTLEPLREALQLPVVITSGFRTKALNDRLAHSSERSQHMEGCAADFYVSCAAEPRFNAAEPRFKVQGSRFSDLKVQSDPRVDDKVQGSRVDDKAAEPRFKVQRAFGPVQGSKFKVQGRRELLIKAFRLIITSPEIDYDQLILYPNFIHVSYVSKERNRHNILKARSNGKLGYGKLSYANAILLNN